MLEFIASIVLFMAILYFFFFAKSNKPKEQHRTKFRAKRSKHADSDSQQTPVRMHLNEDSILHNGVEFLDSTEARAEYITPVDDHTSIDIDAVRLAEKAMDLKAYRGLQTRLKNAKKRVESASPENYDEQFRQMELLERAVEIVGEKVYRHVYSLNEINPHTPLEELKKQNKSLSPEEYNNSKAYRDGYTGVVLMKNSHQLKSVVARYKEEAKKDGLEELIKFRKIIENSKLSSTEKAKKINVLVDKSTYLRTLFFDTEHEIPFYEQYLIGAKMPAES